MSDKLVKRDSAPLDYRDAIKRKRQTDFLKAYSECGTITGACRAAHVNYLTERTWRDKDPWYQAQFKDAITAYKDRVHEVVQDRALNGVKVPIVGRVQGPLGPHDEIIGEKTIHSDLLLMFLAKKVSPEWRDKYDPPREDDKPMETVSPMTRITIQLDMMADRAAGKNAIIDVTPSKIALPEPTEEDSADSEV